MIVLDSSAILAILFGEPGAAAITDGLRADSVASTINLAEVQTKLVRLGQDPDVAWQDAAATPSRILPYTEDHAKLTGSLAARTRHLGLSLGDRSCLALGILLNSPVYTADQIWRNLDIGIPIHIIR